MKLLGKLSFVAILLSFATQAFSDSHLLFQLGGYTSREGKTQDINISGLIGDRYTVKHSADNNALFGLAFLLDAPHTPYIHFTYGIDMFYFDKNTVRGDILQEQAFDNLAYRYQVRNIPFYAVTNIDIPLDSNTQRPQYDLTFSAGIGPNIITTSHYHEVSLDAGNTLTDNNFSGRTKTDLSAMAGIGIKINHAFGNHPIECGYRFFYLGQGSLAVSNNQVQNTLKTASAYANAIICSVAL